MVYNMRREIVWRYFFAAICALSCYSPLWAQLPQNLETCTPFSTFAQEIKNLDEPMARIVVDQVKFDAIRDRFSDAKSALDVALQSASKAVDAAFSAAKEAASKIEVSFTKAIEQLQSLGSAQQKATDDKIDDVRTRVTTLESQKRGSNDSIALMISVVGAVVALIAAVASVVALLRPH